jgi:tetratricopeptide (TPR) repeat protein
MEWFLNHGRVEESLRLGVALEWFWYRYGHFSAGKRWLEAALDLAGEAEPNDMRAKALHALGWMLMIQGDWNRARSLYRESLELFQELGDRLGESVALSDLGVVERFLGNITEGTSHAEAGVRIAREVGDTLQLSIALIWAYSTTGGKFVGEAPRAELEEAVELSRKLENLWGISHALNGLGDLLGELGEYHEARPCYEEALLGFRELKDRWMTAWTLEGLGRISYLDGDNRRAKEYLREGLTLFDSLGDIGSSVFMLRRLGMVARARGDHLRAACLLRAFKCLQETLIGSEAASRMEYTPEVSAAFDEYRNQYAGEWTRRQAMSYKQAVEFALEHSENV